jgi:anti-sigma regulatory factor (Ser/Thr protein kinase)
MTGQAPLERTSWTIEPGNVEGVGWSRRLALQTLTAWGAELPAGVADDLALVLSELVTNGLQHAETDTKVDLELGRTWVRVGVGDGIPPTVVGSLPPGLGPDDKELLSEGGRGLLLTRMVAGQVFVEPWDGGKRIWACLGSQEGFLSGPSTAAAREPLDQPGRATLLDQVRSAAPMSGIAGVLASSRALRAVLASAR